MAEGQSKQNEKEPMVNKAIPKIVNALQSIITKTRDEGFRERCLQKLLINDKTALPGKLESKLWEIAENRLGVKQPSTDDGQDEQVVPERNKIPQTSTVKIDPPQMSSFEKDPFDELALIDISHPLNDDATEDCFYEQLNDTQNLPAQKPPLSPTSTLASSKEFTQCGIAGKVSIKNSMEDPQLWLHDDPEVFEDVSEDDWLKHFTEDSFWMVKSQECSLQTSSYNFLKRQRSPASSSMRKVAATKSQANTCEIGKDQISDDVIVVISEQQTKLQHEVDKQSSDGATSHCQADSDYLSRTISSQTVLVGAQDNLDSSSNENVTQSPSLTIQLSQPCCSTNRNDVMQIIEAYGIEKEILRNDIVSDIHQENSEMVFQGATSPYSGSNKIIDNSLINDFDALADFFDD